MINEFTIILLDYSIIESLLIVKKDYTSDVNYELSKFFQAKPNSFICTKYYMREFLNIKNE